MMVKYKIYLGNVEVAIWVRNGTITKLLQAQTVANIVPGKNVSRGIGGDCQGEEEG
jgi:hypothetical protein